jgi:hypothetical protein
MNWGCVEDSWKQLIDSAKQRWDRMAARQAREKQLAAWVLSRHKIDPIHK